MNSFLILCLVFIPAIGKEDWGISETTMEADFTPGKSTQSN